MSADETAGEAEVTYLEGTNIRVLRGRISKLDELWTIVERRDGRKFIRTSTVCAISFSPTSQMPVVDSKEKTQTETWNHGNEGVSKGT